MSEDRQSQSSSVSPGGVPMAGAFRPEALEGGSPTGSSFSPLEIMPLSDLTARARKEFGSKARCDLLKDHRDSRRRILYLHEDRWFIRPSWSACFAAAHAWVAVEKARRS